MTDLLFTCDLLTPTEKLHLKKNWYALLRCWSTKNQILPARPLEGAEDGDVPRQSMSDFKGDGAAIGHVLLPVISSSVCIIPPTPLTIFHSSTIGATQA